MGESQSLYGRGDPPPGRVLPGAVRGTDPQPELLRPHGALAAARPLPPLAECPDGFPEANGQWHAEPWSLDPSNPATLELLSELYAELLPLFTSDKIHVGADETWDLGKGHNREACATRGLHAVYLDFLRRLRDLARKHGRTAHYWGDMVWNHFPERVPELDRDMVMVDWGYYRAYPFDAHGAALAEAGVPFWFAPGTSVWATLLGCNEACFGSNRSAAVAGVRHGAGGLLNTDWGDGGHWQYLPVSYAGFAAGAAMAWSHAANPDERIAAALDLHVFRDAAKVMGKTALGLADAWQHVGEGVTQAHILDAILRHASARPLPGEVTAATLQGAAAHIQEQVDRLSHARMDRPDAALIVDEFRNGARMAVHACRLGRALHDGNAAAAAVCRELAAGMGVILDEHRRLWLARNRPGGLADSMCLLQQRLAEYTAHA